MVPSQEGLVFVDTLRPEAPDACDAETWTADEVKLLGVEVNDQKLRPRRCELRHGAESAVVAIRFEVGVHETFSLTAADAPTWRFTIREDGELFGNEKGWRLAQLDKVGDMRFSVCLHPE
jgi:hypothetical protein